MGISFWDQEQTELHAVLLLTYSCESSPTSNHLHKYR